MSSHNTESIPKASNIKMLSAMVGIGVMCAALIVLTYQGTFTRIESNKAEALQKAIFKVIPDIETTKVFRYSSEESFTKVEKAETGFEHVFCGYDENMVLKGAAIMGSGQGYADIIKILYGYDFDAQKIVGFYVLESKETPGLGDKIEKDVNFLDNFTSMDVELTDDNSALKNNVKTVKSGTKENSWEIDAITGATISSRAIGEILDKSTARWLPILQENKEEFEINSVKSEN